MDKDNPHQGHRSRLRSLVERAGLDSLNENQVLEFILYYIVPRRDTNEIAHDLLNEFGNVYDVMNANIQELEKVNFLGKQTSNQLFNFKYLCEYYQMSLSKPKQKLRNVAEIISYFSVVLRNRENYEFYALALNENNEILSRRMLYSGKSEINAQKHILYDFAYKNNSNKIILAHNHPNDSCLPTSSDDRATGIIVEWLNENGIQLIDHVIVGIDGTFSFRNQERYV